MSLLRTESKVPYGGLPLALGVMTGVQVLATLMMLALATMAPLVASSLGLGAESVGYQISVIYTAGAMVSAFAGTLVSRYGGCTVSQVALLLGALGCFCLSTGSMALMVVGSILIGASYGMTNPAASEVLNRVTPAGRRGLVFSIKQTGVPLGGVVAGLSLPLLAIQFGWQAALHVVGIMALCVAVGMVPLRPRWDIKRTLNARVSSSFVAGPKLVWANPRLRALALMGFCYSTMQLSLMTFLVVLLVEDVLWSVVAAGSAASLVQGVGALGRIGWGVVSDRLKGGVPVLILIGGVTIMSSLVVSTLTPAWPSWVVLIVFSIFGVAAIGWNGVFIAEVVRSAPSGKEGLATGGALTLTFAGVVVGPSLYAFFHSFFGSYSETFLLLSAFPLVGMILLLFGGRVAIAREEA